MNWETAVMARRRKKIARTVTEIKEEAIKKIKKVAKSSPSTKEVTFRYKCKGCNYNVTLETDNEEKMKIVKKKKLCDDCIDLGVTIKDKESDFSNFFNTIPKAENTNTFDFF